MHKTNPDGTVIESLCDYCRARFEETPMIEGHQGSLICLKCISVAYADLVHFAGGHQNTGRKCTMCLEERRQAQWESPIDPDKTVCLRCIKQAATALEKDPETGWKRPPAPAPPPPGARH